MKIDLVMIIMLIGSLIAGLQAVEAAQDNSKTITVPDDYSTIQAAINNAANGDTIYIKKGVGNLQPSALISCENVTQLTHIEDIYIYLINRTDNTL